MLRSYLRDQNRIFGLDLMRAAAILMVLFGHCAWIYPEDGGIISQLMALCGYLGVEVFFVLSGYLIGGILLKMFLKDAFTAQSVLYFLRRRWFRTLPNYFLILLVNIGIAAWLGYHIEGLWKYFLFLQNFAHPLLPFFPESWSLSIEEFAYVILPLSLLPAGLMVTPRSKSSVFIVVVIVLSTLCLSAKLLYHLDMGTTTLVQWNLALKSVVIYRLDAIFYGVICAWIHFHFRQTWERWRIPAFLTGGALLGFFTIGVGALGLFIDRYPFFWNVLYLPVTSISIACFLPVLSQMRKAGPALAYPITFVSLVSYSVYLLHYSVVLQALKHLVDTDSLSSMGRHAFSAGYIVLTFILSVILYRFFERPVMDLRDARPISR